MEDITKYFIIIYLMKNITNLIDKINALWERQVFSPKLRKTIMWVAYLLGLCFISITSISLLNVNASQNEGAIFEIENVEEIIPVEIIPVEIIPIEIIEEVKDTVIKEKIVVKEFAEKKITPKEVILKKIISDEAIVKNSAKEIPEIKKDILIISGEAIIGDFVAMNELWTKSSLDIMSIWQWSLIKWIANPESVVLIITRTWTECRAKTNTTGKFGCMFANELVWIEDLQITYK